MSEMRVQLFIEPLKIEMRKVEIPTVGPEDVLVRIHAATTCGTDLKTYLRGYPKLKPPIRFGHELAGEIVEVGKNVSGFHAGQRVVPHNSAPCGTCFYCKHEQYNLCPDLIINWGAFADYILIPGPIVRLNTYAIPDHLSYAQAAMMEPLSTVVHGHRVCSVQKGEIVAIVGAGPIGLMHLQLALRSGASKVIAFDLKDMRLKIAQELGATHVYNSQTVDVVEAVKALSEGRGADVAIEATGSIAGWEEAIRIVRPGGRVLLFGGLSGGSMMQMDATKVHYGELKIYGVFHSTPLDVYTAYRLICDEVINTRALISCELPLERLEDALKMMKEGEIIKAAICPEISMK